MVGLVYVGHGLVFFSGVGAPLPLVSTMQKSCRESWYCRIMLFCVQRRCTVPVVCFELHRRIEERHTLQHCVKLKSKPLRQTSCNCRCSGNTNSSRTKSYQVVALQTICIDFVAVSWNWVSLL